MQERSGNLCGNLCGNHIGNMCHFFISIIIFYLSLLFSQS